MSVVEVRAQLPTERLLEAVDQLDQTDLEAFVHQVLALWAKRQAPSLPQAEAELLERINRGLPSKLQTRYNDLVEKRRSESLTSSEYEDLQRLTDQVEMLDAERVVHLAELARLRQVSIGDLIVQLGIQAPPYAWIPSLCSAAAGSR
jgi:hypothetical protein